MLKYDLGHGYCHHKFFSQCPHRMACARCQHYEPKPASAPQLVELQRNHLRLTQTLTLRREELAAVEGDGEAVAALLAKLQDVATPSGETPRELSAASPSSRGAGGPHVSERSAPHGAARHGHPTPRA